VNTIEPLNDSDIHVIVEPAGLVITPHDYEHDPRSREIADRVMTTYGYEPKRVRAIKLNEAAVEVLWYNPDAPVEECMGITRHDLRRGE
jgi:hypothetical protein